MTKRNVLLNPGPATTTEAVKQAQVVPDICPREKEFGDVIASCAKDLAALAGGDECVFFAGSGTAGMDATVNSIVPPNGKVLIINNGAYGARMTKIAEAYGISHEELFFAWDEPITTEKVEEALSDDITTVIMIHHETTTGMLNPVAEVGKVVKEHGCVFAVDTISSFAGIPFTMDELHADFVISTSNKCIQGMAGIVFVICKKDELAKLEQYPKRSFYLNIWQQYAYFKKTYQTPFTPPVQTFYALRKAVDEYLEETPEGRWKRYSESNDVLVAGMEELGFKQIFPPEVAQSKILTTFWEPDDPNFSFDALHDKLYERGFTIYPGKIKEKTFRLSNMGDITKDDITNFLTALKEVLKELGVTV